MRETLPCIALAGFTLASAGLAQAAEDLEDLCAGAEPETRGEAAGLSHVALHRDATDLTGTRIVGCLHNLSEEPLPNLMLAYDHVQERGGGGGTTNLDFETLGPGEAAAFRTGLFTRDRAHYEEWRATGLVIRALERFAQDSWALDAPIELPLPLLDRPAHPVEVECEAVAPEEGEGEVWITHASFEAVGPTGLTSVVGCVTNRSEEPLGEGRSPEIRVQHTARMGAEPNRMGSRGGTGALQLEAPLGPGETALFVTSFEYDDPLLDVEIEPGSLQRVGDDFEFVATGPAITLQRGLED